MGILRISRAKSILISIALVCLGGRAQAALPHPSTRAEREQTKALNEQQLEQVRQQNAGLGINAHPSPIDAAATAANNALPVAAPTTAVQQASNLPPVMAAPVP
jgi:hypothetical protein